MSNGYAYSSKMRYDEISEKIIINNPVKPFSQLHISSPSIIFFRENVIFGSQATAQKGKKIKGN
jgi:hypothetical protein